MFISACSSEAESIITTLKSSRRELEAAGQSESTARKQKVIDTRVQLTSSILYGPGAQLREDCTSPNQFKSRFSVKSY